MGHKLASDALVKRSGPNRCDKRSDFEPKFGKKIIILSPSTKLFTLNKVKSCNLHPEHSAIIQAVLIDMLFTSKVISVLRSQSIKIFTSQVKSTFLAGGFLLKMAFIILKTIGCSPKGFSKLCSVIEDTTDR